MRCARPSSSSWTPGTRPAWSEPLNRKPGCAAELTLLEAKATALERVLQNTPTQPREGDGPRSRGTVRSPASSAQDAAEAGRHSNNAGGNRMSWCPLLRRRRPRLAKKRNYGRRCGRCLLSLREVYGRARRLLDVFRPAHMPGNSTSSGECALANGTLIEFRTFNTGEGASAWLNGAQGQSGQLDRSGAGGVGGNWAIRVSGTTDREAMNRIFQSLPS